MKDKEARADIIRLDAFSRSLYDKFDEFKKDQYVLNIDFSSRINDLRDSIQVTDLGRLSDVNRISEIELKFKKMEEAAIPVCKTCGQKIQEGLQPGQVEQLSVAVKKGKK